MAIPKVIYQTFKRRQLPFINRLAIQWLKFRNKAYDYEFYDDARIEAFMNAEFAGEVANAYNKLNIGAAKADFFRYCILYKKGGVYLDIDAYVPGALDSFIKPDDVAVITEERHPGIFVQWAMIYEAGHPFLKRTIDIVVDNIKHNRYPNSVHGMTGPTPYSQAIHSLMSDKTIRYRVMGVDYNKAIRSRLPFSKLLYKKGEHWKAMEKVVTVLR
ncbi:hypothetical protein GCM10023149_35780 [Mucilaginibacter gynuensis]|uniref:Glycosyl transferase-like sugar-binding protein n=1 Tax=Mucilaginibacter gynuensis TaxID=1302236 RepID=A0ABP8GVK5_9SPHI